MTTPDYPHLEAVARAATQGEWRIARLWEPDIVSAAALITAEWGIDSANDFGEQYRHSKDSGAAVFGCIRDTRIIGMGFVSESEISFGIWGLSWLVVDPKFRRQGIARALVVARELHAANASREGHDTVMQVATPFPALYESLGYSKAFAWDDAILMLKCLNGRPSALLSRIAELTARAESAEGERDAALASLTESLDCVADLDQEIEIGNAPKPTISKR